MNMEPRDSDTGTYCSLSSTPHSPTVKGQEGSGNPCRSNIVLEGGTEIGMTKSAILPIAQLIRLCNCSDCSPTAADP